MSVIYEKHYPHLTFEEEMEKIEEYEKEFGYPPDFNPEPKLTAKEFLANVMENRTLVLLPEKMKKADAFIKLAIKVSEIYRINTKISREDSHIAVDYSFNCAGDMFFLIPVFRQADSISFFTGVNGFEITISLDYYTHAVFNKERLLHPKDVEDCLT